MTQKGDTHVKFVKMVFLEFPIHEICSPRKRHPTVLNYWVVLVVAMKPYIT